MCQQPLNELARPLPFSHCTQSRLMCALSGKPIDEHNPPMVLPNGNVYGRLVSTHGGVDYTQLEDKSCGVLAIKLLWWCEIHSV